MERRALGLWALVALTMVALFGGSAAIACPACYMTPDQINQQLLDETTPSPGRPLIMPPTPTIPVSAPANAAPAPAPGPTSWYDRGKGLIDDLQARAGRMFAVELNALKAHEGSAALLWALALGFAYGALHALGPGHGKILVLSYFAGQNARPRQGVIMGAQIAVFHVLSAVVSVVVADILWRAVMGTAPGESLILRQASYALIAGTGAYILMDTLRRRPQAACAACAHDHDHGHGHHHDHGHLPSDGQPDRRERRQRTILSAAIGAVPCTGAVAVLSFAFANDLVIEGVMIVAAISFGMALTLAAMGMAAIYSSGYVQRRLGDEGRPGLGPKVLRGLGGLTIALFGLSLMVAAA